MVEAVEQEFDAARPVFLSARSEQGDESRVDLAAVTCVASRGTEMQAGEEPVAELLQPRALLC